MNVKRNQLTVILVFCSVTLAARGQIKPQQPSPVVITNAQTQGPLPGLNEARRITRKEAAALVKSNSGTYVDVRSAASFAAGHIPGAINIPHSQLMDRLREIPPGKTVITYCACVAEHTAALSVLELNRHGYRNAAALIGGWKDWLTAGLPVEKGVRASK